MLDVAAFHSLPELTGPELGVPEFLNQAGLDLVGITLLGQELLEGVLEHAHDAQSLDPLSSPVGTDLAGVTAPELLGIPLEEHGIELAAEAVDVEVLQVVFRQLVNQGLQIAETGLHGQFETHCPQGLERKGDGVIQEMVVPVDS